MTEIILALADGLIISTHTLRKEGDRSSAGSSGGCGIFQPTPSARRVTEIILALADGLIISTHTLRKEGDYFVWTEDGANDLISTHTLRKEGDTIMRDDTAKHT